MAMRQLGPCPSQREVKLLCRARARDGVRHRQSALADAEDTFLAGKMQEDAAERVMMLAALV